DLDGTLIKSDTLYDSLCLLMRRHPLQLFRLPGQLLRGGKAAVKAGLHATTPLDAPQLPYNGAVLKFIEDQHRQGRAIYLATGADSALAERVAAHLGIFAGVIASDGSTNMIGSHKLAGLRQRFSEFDYIGNARPDLPALAASRKAF